MESWKPGLDGSSESWLGYDSVSICPNKEVGAELNPGIDISLADGGGIWKPTVALSGVGLRNGRETRLELWQFRVPKNCGQHKLWYKRRTRPCMSRNLRLRTASALGLQTKKM